MNSPAVKGCFPVGMRPRPVLGILPWHLISHRLGAWWARGVSLCYCPQGLVTTVVTDGEALGSQHPFPASSGSSRQPLPQLLSQPDLLRPPGVAVFCQPVSLSF